MKQEQIDRRRKSVKYPYWWHRSYSLTEIYLLVQICFSSNEEIDTNDKKVKCARQGTYDSNCIVQFPWNFSLLQLDKMFLYQYFLALVQIILFWAEKYSIKVLWSFQGHIFRGDKIKLEVWEVWLPRAVCSLLHCLSIPSSWALGKHLATLESTHSAKSALISTFRMQYEIKIFYLGGHRALKWHWTNNICCLRWCIGACM